MDNGTSEKKIKRFARLGYDALETVELVEAMNTVIANFAVHYQKLRNFHWNITGPDFFDIHEKFEVQYNEAQVAIDVIAERVRVFGATPLSTYKEFLERSDIKEASPELTAHEMLGEVINDYETLIEKLYRVIEISLENGDSGTEDIAKKYVKQLEKNHWMMSSFAQSR